MLIGDAKTIADAVATSLLPTDEEKFVA